MPVATLHQPWLSGTFKAYYNTDEAVLTMTLFGNDVKVTLDEDDCDKLLRVLDTQPDEDWRIAEMTEFFTGLPNEGFGTFKIKHRDAQRIATEFVMISERLKPLVYADA